MFTDLLLEGFLGLIAATFILLVLFVGSVLLIEVIDRIFDSFNE